MARKISYSEFINKLDARLESCFKQHEQFVCCKAGCSACCEKGDYPVSNLELEYLMQGFINLENTVKSRVQANIKTMVKGGKCPFLIDNLCSVYPYRPIICRTHGLAYLMKDGRVNVPYCVHDGKNYASVYNNGEFLSEPVRENLSTLNLLSAEFPDIVINDMYDWLRNEL